MRPLEKHALRIAGLVAVCLVVSGAEVRCSPVRARPSLADLQAQIDALNAQLGNLHPPAIGALAFPPDLTGDDPQIADGFTFRKLRMALAVSGVVVGAPSGGGKTITEDVEVLLESAPGVAALASEAVGLRSFSDIRFVAYDGGKGNEILRLTDAALVHLRQLAAPRTGEENLVEAAFDFQGLAFQLTDQSPVGVVPSLNCDDGDIQLVQQVGAPSPLPPDTAPVTRFESGFDVSPPGGPTPGEIDFVPFRVATPVTGDAACLFTALTQDATIPSVTLRAYGPFSDSEPELEIVYLGTKLTGYVLESDGRGAFSQELTFVYAEVQVIRREILPDGTQGASQTWGYDVLGDTPG